MKPCVLRLYIITLFILESAAHDDDKIDERPNTDPAERNEHQDTRADLPDVKPMDPKRP
jgi:hypothetical protein